MLIVTVLVYLIFSYLLGSVLFAMILTKFMDINDPRSYGSKNAGATNVMRSGNKKAGILTFLGDFIKGLLVVLVAKYVFKNYDNPELYVGVSAILVVLGHIFPVFFNFKGGKGVSTMLGVLFAINYLVGLITVFTWLLVFKIFKISSLSALVALLLAPIYIFCVTHNYKYFILVLFLSLIVIAKHKDNILKLILRKESSFKNKK